MYINVYMKKYSFQCWLTTLAFLKKSLHNSYLKAVHVQHHKKYGNNIKGLTTVVYQQITDLQQNKYLKDFLPQTEILKNLLIF